MNRQKQVTRTPFVVILSHVCIDENVIEGISYRSWGSPAMYVAAYYARQYGVKTHIISEYGMDFTEYINDFTLMANTPRGDHTLIYKNIVKNGRRTQYCPNPENSTPVSLTKEVIALIASADILIVAPNIPNYSDTYISNAVTYARSQCKKILMPQGLLRRINDSLVTKGSLANPAILSLFDVVIISDEDINGAVPTATLWSKQLKDTIIVITQARQGATLAQNGKSVSIPTDYALNDDEIINSVGAGDMFSAELTMKLFEGAPLEQAVRSAHRSTATILASRIQEDLTPSH